jgi:hypothetical protein
VASLLCALLSSQVSAQASSPPPLVPAPSVPVADPYDPKDSPSETDPYGGYEGEDEAEGQNEPRGELIPHRWEPFSGLGSKAPRLVLETLGGLGLGIASTVPGAVLLWNHFCLDCSEGADTILASLGLMAVGMSVGSAGGVYAVGGLMGGQGRFLPTLAGSTLGLLAGGLAAALVGAAFGEVAAFLPLLTFPTLGALIAYERVHSEEASRKATSAAGVEVTPIVSARPSGVVVGLVGRF